METPYAFFRRRRRQPVRSFHGYGGVTKKKLFMEPYSSFRQQFAPTANTGPRSVYNNAPVSLNPSARWGQRRGALSRRSLGKDLRPTTVARPSVFTYNNMTSRPNPRQASAVGNKGVTFHQKREAAPLAVDSAIRNDTDTDDSQARKPAEDHKNLSCLTEKFSQLLSDNNCPKSAMKMADDKSTDLSQKAYFTVGSQIKCRFQGDDVEGQVAAFNHSDRILMIRSASSCGKSSTSNFILINADCVDKISVEDPTPTDNLKPVDFQKLEKRRQKLSANKKSRIRALSAGVPPEARKLFLTIIKTIDEVTWEGDKILVLNEVKISPPYRVEDVQGDKDASVVHVKKIVDKHWKELASNSVST